MKNRKKSSHVINVILYGSERSYQNRVHVSFYFAPGDFIEHLRFCNLFNMSIY